MRRLVGDLLLLARADAERVQPHRPTDLAEVLTDAAAELGPVADDHELSDRRRAARSSPASRDDLHRLVLNLLENAVRHTPPGTHVLARTASRRRHADADRRGRRPGDPAGAPATRVRALRPRRRRRRARLRPRARDRPRGRRLARRRRSRSSRRRRDRPGTRFVIRIPQRGDARRRRRRSRRSRALRPRRRPAAPSAGAAAGRRRTPRGRRAAPAGAGRSRARRRSRRAPSERSTSSRISSTSSSACSMNGTPRKITSGRRDRLAALLGDRRDDDEDPVGRQHPAVAQRDVGRIADVDAVDEDHPRLLGLAEARAALVDLERQPVLAAEHVVGVDPDGVGELRVQVDPLVVAVDRHHVARLDEVQHQLQLLGVAVARGVDRRVARS